jgi:hypothetical protein
LNTCRISKFAVIAVRFWIRSDSMEIDEISVEDIELELKQIEELLREIDEFLEKMGIAVEDHEG